MKTIGIASFGKKLKLVNKMRDLLSSYELTTRRIIKRGLGFYPREIADLGLAFSGSGSRDTFLIFNRCGKV